MGRSVRAHVWKQIDQSGAITIIWARGDHRLDQSSSNESNEKYLNSKYLSKVASFADRVNEGHEKKRGTALWFSAFGGAHLMSWGRLWEGRLGIGGESRVWVLNTFLTI